MQYLMTTNENEPFSPWSSFSERTTIRSHWMLELDELSATMTTVTKVDTDTCTKILEAEEGQGRGATRQTEKVCVFHIGYQDR